MPLTVAQLQAVVSVQGADTAKSQLQDVGNTVNNTGGIFKNMLGGALSLAAGAAGAALGFLKNQLVDSVQAAIAHQDIMAQTAQAIKSTGDASGMSAQAISNLATSLSQVTPFSDDTIQSGENLLLTFTGIGKQVFPQATSAMLDMAQAMHQGPTQAALMLGKALNDPTTGLTALTRVGVTFSDSEKEQIKTMMSHNDVIGAQNIMLKELQKEFGGSAEAAGKTFGGQLQILKNDVQDVQQKLGTALLPVLSALVGVVSNDLMPVLNRFGDWLSSPTVTNFANSVAKDVAQAFTDIGKAGAYVWDVLRTINLSDFISAFKSVGFEVEYVGQKLGGLLSNLNPLKNASADFDPLADAIAKIASSGLGAITNILWGITGAFIAIDRTAQSGGFTNIGNQLANFGKAIVNLSPANALFQVLSANAQQLGKWFQSSVIPALNQAKPGFDNLGKAVVGLLPVFESIAGTIHGVLVTAFTALLPIIEKAIPIVIQLAGIIANLLGQAIIFISPYIVQATKVIGQFADEVITRVEPIIINWLNSLQSGLNTFMHIWNAVWPYLAPILQGVWTEIRGIIQIAWSLISGIILIGLDILSGNWSQAWTDMKNMLSGIWSGIQTYISGALQTVNNLFDGLPGQALQWGEDMINGFIQGIQNTLGSLGNTISSIASTISSQLHFSKPDTGPLADVDTYMPDFMSLLADGMNQNLSKVRDATRNVAQTMVGGLSVPSLSSWLPGGVSGVSGITGGGTIQVVVSFAGQTPQGVPLNITMNNHQFGRVFMPMIVANQRIASGNVGV